MILENPENMQIVLAGAGSVAHAHIKALKNIEGVVVVGVVAKSREEAEAFSKEYSIPRVYNQLSEAASDSDTEAIILATPTPLHAKQSIEVMEAGKHVLIEIPMADSMDDSRAIVSAQKKSGVTAMVCHTRRFNPPHQWIHNKIVKNELHLHHLIVETYFSRKANKNAMGVKRDWSDNLLWHHGCHSVDLFSYQTKKPIIKRWAMHGPISEKINVPLDMNIGLQNSAGQLATIALSFNNEGPYGSWFRYICEEGTFKVRYDEMTNGKNQPIDYTGDWVSQDGIELQDREFINAIREGREPRASVAQCFDTMEILHKLEYVAKN